MIELKHKQKENRRTKNRFLLQKTEQVESKLISADNNPD